MKLKEKLAEEYLEESGLWGPENGRIVYDENDIGIQPLDAKEAYLAGFEKAREIILVGFKECEKNDYYIELPYSCFKNLGEEEI